jgi:hypothetical protein
VRRLYLYLVAGLALAYVAGSLAALLRLLADAVLAPPVSPDDARRDLALQLSNLVVALPVWLSHWRSIRELTAGPTSGEETRSAIRRLYLYLAVFAGIAVLLVSLSWIVFDLVKLALGLNLDRALGVELAHLAANAAVAAATLWYHWWLVLRADLAVQRQALAGRLGTATVTGLDAELAERLQRFATESLDGARVSLSWAERQPEADLEAERRDPGRA